MALRRIFGTGHFAFGSKLLGAALIAGAIAGAGCSSSSGVNVAPAPVRPTPTPAPTGSKGPTPVPTGSGSPTTAPSGTPTTGPTTKPSGAPTTAPTTGPTAAPTGTPAPTPIPTIPAGAIAFTVMNKSGITPGYYTVEGLNGKDLSDTKSYHMLANGQLVPILTSDCPVDSRDSTKIDCDYNIPMSANPVPMPPIRAGRVYLSLGGKFVLQATPNGMYASAYAANGWSSPSDPNWNTQWDWFEFDYKTSPDTGLLGYGSNLTQVDMFGVPYVQMLTSRNGATQQAGFNTGGWSLVTNGLASDANFSNDVIRSGGRVIRQVSLDHGMTNFTNNTAGTPQINPAPWTAYVAAIWAYYRTNTLTAYTSAFGTWTGQVNGSNQLVFTQSGGTTYTFPMPSANDAVTGSGALAAVCTAYPIGSPQSNACLEIVSSFSAAFNRSMLLIYPVITRNYTNNSCLINEFYTAQPPTPINQYAHLIHQASIATTAAPNGAAYAFGYDDNCNQSSFVADNSNPSALTIVIQQ